MTGTQLRRWFLTACFAAMPCIAVSAAGLNIFSSGQPMRSAEVNENFAQLDARLRALESRSWQNIGKIDTWTGFVELVEMYPPSDYQWGVDTNGAYGQVHPVTMTSWKGGTIIVTNPYLFGEQLNEEPREWNMGFGGTAWLYNSTADADDACTAQDRFHRRMWKHTKDGLLDWGFAALDRCSGDYNQNFFIRPH